MALREQRARGAVVQVFADHDGVEQRGGEQIALLVLALIYMAITGVVFALLLSGLQEELQTTIPWVDFVASGEADAYIGPFCRQLVDKGLPTRVEELPHGLFGRDRKIVGD